MSTIPRAFGALTPPSSPPSSPLAQYRAQLQQGFLTRPQLPAPQGEQPPTPSYSRGTYTMVDQGDVRIEVDLGPLEVNHIFRGASRALQVSVYA